MSLLRKKKINVAIASQTPTTLGTMRDVLLPDALAFAAHFPWLRFEIECNYQRDYLCLLAQDRETGMQLNYVLMTRLDIDNRNYVSIRPIFEAAVLQLRPGHHPASITSLQDSLVQEYDDILEGQAIMDELNQGP